MYYQLTKKEMMDGIIREVMLDCYGDDESFDVPEGVMRIGDQPDCPNLRRLTLPASVDWIRRDLFKNCPQLREVIVAQENPVYSAVDGVLYTEDRTCAYLWCANGRRDVDLEIPEGVTTIDKKAFYRCRSIRSVTIPASVRCIENEAFMECENLTRVLIRNSPDKRETLLLKQKAFFGCPALRSVVIGDGARLEMKKEVFRDCTSLEEVSIPSASWRIPPYAFNGCKSLQSIEIPEGVLYIEKRAFEDCEALASVKLPEALRNIDYGAFSGCKSLTEITLNERLREIDARAFWCSGLRHITLAKNMKRIQKDLFYWCESLESVEIIGKILSVGESAFDHCEALSSINLPDSLKRINAAAFRGCRSLKHLTIPSGVTKLDQSAFDDCGLQTITHGDVTYRVEDEETRRSALEKIDAAVKEADRLPKKQIEILRRYAYMDEFEYLGRDSDEDAYGWRKYSVDEDYNLFDGERDEFEWYV